MTDKIKLIREIKALLISSETTQEQLHRIVEILCERREDK
jgi:hypothetical protein